ncbi:MAG: hypothetical protein IJY50_02380 [Clostridia bacterium]|nr:hypothetical protein [Clostridia bacterium]
MGEQQQRKQKNLYYLIVLIINTVLFFAVYRILLYYAELTDDTYWSFLVMVLYMALLLGFTMGYLIYNRFLYRKGLTPDRLNPDWSEEQKMAFLADGEARLQKSRWMMTVIFPLLFTFFIDIVDLFIIDAIFR